MSTTDKLVDLMITDRGSLQIQMPPTLDSVNASSVKTTCLRAITSEVREIEIDLSQTTFMDSAGIGVLVRLYKATKENENTLSLVQASGQPLSLIQSVQIDKVVNLK